MIWLDYRQSYAHAPTRHASKQVWNILKKGNAPPVVGGLGDEHLQAPRVQRQK